MKTIKTSFLLFILFSFFASFTPAKKGVPYQSAEGKLSVVFPAAYETDRSEDDDKITVKVSCTVDGQTYFASYTLHKIEITDHQEMAEVSYDSFITSVKGSLISKSEWKIKDNIGLKAIMVMPDEDNRIEYRVMLVDSFQYQLVVFAPSGTYNEKEAAVFFKSFKLLK